MPTSAGINGRMASARSRTRTIAATLTEFVTKSLTFLRPDELAYYAAQPLWFVVVTDIALAAAIGAALGLLFRTRAAVWMYALSLGLIACIAACARVCASAMTSRGVLH